MTENDPLGQRTVVGFNSIIQEKLVRRYVQINPDYEGMSDEELEQRVKWVLKGKSGHDFVYEPIMNLPFEEIVDEIFDLDRMFKGK